MSRLKEGILILNEEGKGVHLHRIQRKTLSQLEISVSFLRQPLLSIPFYETGDVLYDSISGQQAYCFTSFICTVRW